MVTTSFDFKESFSQILVPKSPYVWKKVEGSGCGLEQAPVMVYESWI